VSPVSEVPSSPTASRFGGIPSPSKDGVADPAQIEFIDDLVQHGAAVAGLHALSAQSLITLIQQLFYGRIRRRGASGIPLSTVALERAEIAAEDKAIKSEQAVAEKRLEDCRVRRDQLREAYAVESAGVRATDWILSFILGVSLIGVAIYLFHFYMSVFYNAFMFEPLSQHGLARSAALNSTTLINPKAWQVAQSNPILYLYPFVFFALGLVLHAAWERKWRLALGAILVGTLLFDGFLAAEIVRKVHEAEYMLGKTPKPWTDFMFIHEPKFYLIMFSGFLTFVVWGGLIGVFLAQVEKLHPGAVKNRLKLAEEEFDRLESSATGLPARQSQLDKLRALCAGAFDEFRLDVASVFEGFQRAIAAQWAHEPHKHMSLVQEAKATCDRERERLEGLVR
jgi:hypothetical protein